ncbi:MAG: thiamine-phosphate kinase [Caldimicrobium sp.]
MTEKEWIKYLKKFLYEKDPVFAAHNEDCSVVKISKNKYFLYTTDALVEGIHFDLRFTDFYSLGYKLAASNLSDIAAMGGTPKWALLTMGSPKPPEKDWIDPFMKALTKLLKKYKARLIGGDTVKSPFYFFNLALTGETNLPLLRSGAKEGDLVFVSKRLGGSAAFLRYIKNTPLEKIPAHLKKSYLQPEPEIALGKKLRKIAHAVIDISDGLLLDLYRICEASRVSAELEEEKIPLSKGALLHEALSGGEDYALLFTISEEKKEKLFQISKKLKKTLFYIGKITRGKHKIFLKTKEGVRKELTPSGYDHFTFQPQL